LRPCGVCVFFIKEEDLLRIPGPLSLWSVFFKIYITVFKHFTRVPPLVGLSCDVETNYFFPCEYMGAE
jgi:hypothetical protein